MKSNQEKYKDLTKKYTAAEIAENFYVTKEMTPAEKKQSDEEIWNIRKKSLEAMTPEDKVYAGLLRLKYTIESYIDNNIYEESKTVAIFLKEYMNILNKKQKDLATDLGIHKTRLSRILNGREKVSLQLAYRLEIHSGDLIPAILWWKLVQKEVEREIREDKKERKREKRNVRNIVYSNK